MTRTTKYPKPFRAPTNAGWSLRSARALRSEPIPSSSAALLWPWITSAPPDFGGHVIGTMNSGAIFEYDAHAWYRSKNTHSMNAVLMGTTGSGKSTTGCAMVLRALEHPAKRVTVIDGKSDWARYAAAYGGKAVEFTSDTAINLLEVPPGTTADDAKAVRVRSVKALVSLAANRTLTAAELWALEEAVSHLEGNAPLLSDLGEIVLNPPPYEEIEGGHAALAAAGRDLLPAFGRLTGPRSPMAAILNRPSTVRFDREERFFVVSLGNLSLASDLRTAALIAVTGWIDAAVVGNQHDRLLVMDEAWRMFEAPQAAIEHSERLKLARANNLATLMILHKPSDFATYGEKGSTHRNAVESMLGYADTIACGRLAFNEAEALQSLIHLNDRERDLIVQATDHRFLWSVQTTTSGRKSWVVRTAMTEWERDMWDTTRIRASEES